MSQQITASSLESFKELFVSFENYLTRQLELEYGEKNKLEIYRTKLNLFELSLNFDYWSKFILYSQRTVPSRRTDLELFTLLDKAHSFILLEKSFTEANILEPNIWMKLRDYSFFRISRETMFPELPNELSNYINVGNKIKDSKEILEINDLIQSLRLGNSPSPSIYTAIIGPSFLGKTQSAFTLAHLMNVLYVNFAAESSIAGDATNLQDIYAPFTFISWLFKVCLETDISVLKSLNISLSATSISKATVSFQTLGLLYFLFTFEWSTSVHDRFLQYINMKNVIIPKLEIFDFKLSLQSKEHFIGKTIFKTFNF